MKSKMKQRKSGEVLNLGLQENFIFKNFTKLKRKP